MSALHIFDMDGTLLRSTASVELARHLGHSAELAELERLSARGELSNLEFHRRTHRLWQVLDDDAVDLVFESAPWIANIPAVIADIRDRGETVIAISMSPHFFVERLTGFGVQEAFASVNPIGGPIDETLILEDFHKVSIAESVVQRLGIPASRVIAYGDSYTDVPLFKSGIYGIAVNASEQVESLAAARYRGDDLTGAYALAREVLDE